MDMVMDWEHCNSAAICQPAERVNAEGSAAHTVCRETRKLIYQCSGQGKGLWIFLFWDNTGVVSVGAVWRKQISEELVVIDIQCYRCTDVIMFNQ